MQLEKKATDKIFEKTAQEHNANNSSMRQRMLQEVYPHADPHCCHNIV